MGKKKRPTSPIYRAALAARRAAGEEGKAPGWRHWVDVVDVAKLVRARLRAKVPGVRFRVTSDRYSGGASVDVGWTDGPSESDVKAEIGAYAGCGFDGMTDSRYHVGAWLHRDGRASIRRVEGHTHSPRQTVPTLDREAVPVSFGANFVQCHRIVSPERWAVVIAAYAERFADPLADAIKAGTVTKIGDAGRVRVDPPGWGDMALRRFEGEIDALRAEAATG